MTNFAVPFETSGNIVAGNDQPQSDQPYDQAGGQPYLVTLYL